MGERDRSDWRTLCAAAAVETDSTKLNLLVAQIIQSLETRKPSASWPPLTIHDKNS